MLQLPWVQEDSDKTAVLIFLSVLGALLANIQPMFLGVLAESHGLNTEKIGLLGGLELGGSALASLSSLYWYGRFSLIKTVVFSLAVAVLGNAITAFVSDFLFLLILRFIIGFLGAGLLYSLVLGLIGQARNPDRVIALAIVAQIISLAAAMLLIPYVMATWQILGVCLTLAAVFLSGYLALPSLWSCRVVLNQDQSQVMKITWQPIVLIIAMVIFCCGIGGVWTFMERIGNALSISMAEVGGALAAGGLLGGSGAVLAAVIGLRFGRILPLLCGLALAVVAAIGLAEAQSYWQFFFFQALFNFCWNLNLPYIMGAIARTDRSGRCMTLVPAAQAGGYAMGATLSGFVITDGAVSQAGYWAAALFVACALILLPLLRRISLSNTEIHFSNNPSDASTEST